jgi:hypothetical protein
MLTKRRNLTISICMALIIASGVFGVLQLKPHVTVPQQSDIKSIQVVFNSTSPNPRPILPNSSRGKTAFEHLLQLLKSAKSMGYEQSSPYIMSMGPTEVIIELQNHQEIDISEAWLPATFTEPNGKIQQGRQRSNEYVDIQLNDTTKMIRYYSPRLVAWLDGGWQREQE